MTKESCKAENDRPLKKSRSIGKCGKPKLRTKICLENNQNQYCEPEKGASDENMLDFE